MRCASCEESAVIGDPFRCKKHFLEHFERKVKDTIEKYELVKSGQNIAVAASGGKDSLTVLYLLKKWKYNITAIVVDEGIADYREHTMKDLEKACADWDVPLIVKSYEEYAGKPLDVILKEHNMNPCAICGTFRRHLISLASKDFDVLVTGHNADDEAQTILMNLLRGHTGLFARGGPKTGVGARGFTQRVKPLFFCTEKEVMTYAFLNGFVSDFTECPNAAIGYRFFLRDELNMYAKNHPNVKQQMLARFLEMKKEVPREDMEMPRCESCGEPSQRETCMACSFLAKVQD